MFMKMLCVVYIAGGINVGTTMAEKLLSTNFFTVCKTHSDSARSECNMYCLDCNGDSFASIVDPLGTKIIIRRSSYHDVVRVSEVQKVLDINGVLFLNERLQPKASSGTSSTKGVSHLEICSRSLRSFSILLSRLGPTQDDDITGCNNQGMISKMMKISRNHNRQRQQHRDHDHNHNQTQELREGIQHEMYPSPPTPPPQPPSFSSPIS
ncbi:hypothetical protein MKW92_026353 [Papaver armeniacum]|nr:hypothetical protein MKW92_026353 [Papaver armeniacum]